MDYKLRRGRFEHAVVDRFDIVDEYEVVLYAGDQSVGRIYFRPNGHPLERVGELVIEGTNDYYVEEANAT